MLGSGLTEPILVSLPFRDRQTQLVRMARPRRAPVRPAPDGRVAHGARLGAGARLRPRSSRLRLDDRGRQPPARGARPARGPVGHLVDRRPGPAADALRQRAGPAVRDAVGKPSRRPSTYLRENATADRSRIGIMGDDGEKFGGWPGTHELCWGEGAWMSRFFDAVEENARLARHRAAVGLVWTRTRRRPRLRSDDLVPGDDRVGAPVRRVRAVPRPARRRRRRAGLTAQRFLFGGFWRGVRRRATARSTTCTSRCCEPPTPSQPCPPGRQQERALRHLLRGQSNDVYWHGLFGGIYLVHLRLAVAAELIGAYDLACGGAPETLHRGPGPRRAWTRSSSAATGTWHGRRRGGRRDRVVGPVRQPAGRWLGDAPAARGVPRASCGVIFEQQAAESSRPPAAAPRTTAARRGRRPHVVEAAAAMTTEEQVVLLHEGIEDSSSTTRTSSAVRWWSSMTQRRATLGPPSSRSSTWPDLGDFVGWRPRAGRARRPPADASAARRAGRRPARGRPRRFELGR